MKNLVLALGGLTVAAAPAAAQAVWECTIGQRVVDARGTAGVIVSAHGDECLIKYDGGQTQGWAPWQALRGAAPAKSAVLPLAAPRVAPLGSAGPPPGNGTAAVAILKPVVSNRLFTMPIRGVMCCSPPRPTERRCAFWSIPAQALSS